MTILTKRHMLILGLALLIAIGCSIYIMSSPGFAVTPVLVMTMVAVALTGTLAYVLVIHTSDRVRDIGAALVSGVIFLLAAAMTQAASDVNNFRNSLAFEQNLHGFDPGGRSLRGLNLGGKDLSVANLSQTDLRRARLREADLSTADLSDAHLDRADLYYAQLHEADVHGAIFTHADLRGAKFDTGFLNNLDQTTLSGATVSEETCWRIPRSQHKNALPNITPTKRGWATIDLLKDAGIVPYEPGRAIGHLCTKDDGESDLQHPPEDIVYVCPEALFLRTRKMMTVVPGRTGVYCSTP